MSELTHRLATPADIPGLAELMQSAITENMKPFLSAAEIEAAKETMGVDRTLIKDKTYFVIESVLDGKSIMVGCGGWGKRRTLYGGDHTLGRDDSFCNPAVDAARIRAMYTRPSWVRRGVGTLLLEIGEACARDAGYKSIELGSTVAGQPFYVARGYKEIDRNIHPGSNGADKVVIRMAKEL
jgi:GNAT superfamily N-acetyltransferase